MEEKGKKLGLINLLGYGLGSAVGTGIFVMMGFGIAYTGRSIMLVTAVGCFFMLLAFWYNMSMATMFSFNGGDYSMRTLLFNPLLTGVAAWFTVMQNLVMAGHSIAIAGYLAMLSPWVAEHITLTAFIILVAAFLTTIRGASFVTRLQNIVTFILVVALVIFVLFGIGKVDAGYFFSNADGGFFHDGFGGFVGAISIMSFACMGTSGVISLTAVTKNPKKLIPLSIIIVTAILALIYALMSYVAAGILPYDQIAGANLSVTAEVIMPHGVYLFFVIGGGICAIGSTLLGVAGGMRYPMQQVADDGWLPAIFKRTTKGGYPWFTYLVMFVVSSLPILTGMDIETIVSDIMIPTMMMNVYMNLMCVILPRRFPEQWEKRSIKIPVWLWQVFSVLGALADVVIIYNLFTSLAMKDAVICVVVCVALVALSILRIKQGAVSKEKLEEIKQQTVAEALATE